MHHKRSIIPFKKKEKSVNVWKAIRDTLINMPLEGGY